MEDVLGLPPPLETIQTLPPGSARQRQPPTHRSYTLSHRKMTPSQQAVMASLLEAPLASIGEAAPMPVSPDASAPVDVGEGKPSAGALRISARTAQLEQEKIVQQEEAEELEEKLAAISESFE